MLVAVLPIKAGSVLGVVTIYVRRWNVSEYEKSWRPAGLRSDAASAERGAESGLAGPLEVEESGGGGRKRSAATGSRSDFTEPSVPCQFKLPRDLVASLKLHSISSGKSMSEIVTECCTSPEWVSKAWVSSRKSA